MGFLRSPFTFPTKWTLPFPTGSGLLLGASTGKLGVEPHAFDPAFKRLFMYLLVGTKGGFNRLKIMKLIQSEPLNPNKIGEKLGLDYKTVQSIPWYTVVVLAFDPDAMPNAVTGQCTQVVKSDLLNPTGNCLNSIAAISAAAGTKTAATANANSTQSDPIYPYA